MKGPLKDKPNSLSQFKSAFSHAIPTRSLQFEYHSLSSINPALPSADQQGQGMTIDCQSHGNMHVATPHAHDLIFIFEFSMLACGETNLLEERNLPLHLSYSRDFLASAAAMEQALEHPGLAIARSLYFHQDAGQRERWSAAQAVLVNQELRVEGQATPQLKVQEDSGVWNWQKTFAGVLPSGKNPPGLQHSLDYEVKGQSQTAIPMELGLLNLQGKEKSVTMQSNRTVAKTEIQIRMHRITAVDNERLNILLADANAPVDPARPKLSIEERDRLLRHWQKFRDKDGLKPLQGESVANQSVYIELKQALRRDPSIAQELAADLQGLDPASSGFATLAGALIYSGVSPALDAFVAQAELRHRDMNFQSRALPMIGLAPQPDLVSWKYLDQARRLQKSSQLGVAAELGMATHLKQGYQDKGAEEFVEEISQRMLAANTEAKRLHLLDLVGNAGLEKLLPLVESWLKQGTPAMRLRIAQSLRHMQDLKAEQLLLELAADTNLELSLTALQSLRDRTPSLSSLSGLLDLLERPHHDRVQLLILENLYAARSLDPMLLDKIQKIRDTLTLSPNLSEAWDQLEEDWADSAGA